MRALVVLAVLLAALASGCGGSSGEPAAPPMATTPSGSMRQSAPPLEGVSLDGEAITLEGFRGRPVLVNVWSSW